MSEEKLSIKHWNADDRPREKMLRHGAETLTDAELLAILVGSGNAEEDAVSLMQRILDDHAGSLAQVRRMSFEELCSYKGIGEAKATFIMAACELRTRADRPLTSITCSADIYEFFRPLLRDKSKEESHLLLLNNAHKIIGHRTLATGGLTQTLVDIREVLRHALLAQATAIVLVHNHPSGNANPSTDDDTLTHRLYEAAQTMMLRLIDHIVFTDASYYSYADQGRLIH